jgi:hypothetical protein
MPTPGIDFPFTVFKIANMERKLDDIGTVYTVHYTVTRFRDGEQAGAYGSLADAIPYPQLTEEIVVGWVRDQLGEEKVTEIDAALDAQISQKLTPTTSTGVPW